MKSLIINSPYARPARHWVEARPNTPLAIVESRRPAGYEIFDPRSHTKRTVTLGRVNEIRTRLEAWQQAGRPGLTSVSRSLIEHWHDKTARTLPLYFCQLEAIESLIWWVEAPADYKQGVHLPGDGGAWERLCNKMATGTGKTTVMAMIVAWQALNALTYPKRKDFSSAVFLVAPGLTVRERLQVLLPGLAENYYDQFSICPNESLRQRLNQAEIVIENWHTLMPLEKPQRSVIKKGAETKLYHLYSNPEVSEDLNRKAAPEEPLPDLVHKGYTLLAADWREAAENWKRAGHPCPPVMLTVCNRTETAARVERFFN